jgi:hypothetical protein
VLIIQELLHIFGLSEDTKHKNLHFCIIMAELCERHAILNVGATIITIRVNALINTSIIGLKNVGEVSGLYPIVLRQQDMCSPYGE